MGDGCSHLIPLAGGRVFSSTTSEGAEGVGEAKDTRSREGGRRVLAAIMDQPLVNVKIEERRSRQITACIHRDFHTPSMPSLIIIYLATRHLLQLHQLHHCSTPIFQRADCYNSQYNNQRSRKRCLLKYSHGGPFAVVGFGENQ